MANSAGNYTDQDFVFPGFLQLHFLEKERSRLLAYDCSGDLQNDAPSLQMGFLVRQNCHGVERIQEKYTLHTDGSPRLFQPITMSWRLSVLLKLRSRRPKANSRIPNRIA